MNPLAVLGSFPVLNDLTSSITRELWRSARPVAERFLADPQGSISRVGDILIWQGAAGERVLGGLESLGDNTDRIRSVVEGLETTAISTSTGVSSLANLSMLTLGVSSLSAAFMMIRLQSLERRMKGIDRSLKDIRQRLEAHQKVSLQTAVQYLDHFEKRGKDRDLEVAQKEATDATHLHRNLLAQELKEEGRLEALHLLSRNYLPALLIQTRCLELQHEGARAIAGIFAEENSMTELGQRMFDSVLGVHPEQYLDHRLSADGVTLQLLHEIFQAAKNVGVNPKVDGKNAGEVFELLRPNLAKARMKTDYFGRVAQTKTNLLQRLKYLMAGLEELGRVRAMKRRLEHLQRMGASSKDFEKNLSDCRQRWNGNDSDRSTFIYAFV